MAICDRCGLNYRSVCVSRECKRTPDITPLPPRPLSDRERATRDALRATVEQIRHDNESEATQRAVDADMGVSEWEAFMPQSWHKGRAALAPFQATDGH